ncbi:hypothetical protein I551_3056 [Mycobacterium ulcerans str. Harvey]|uniref:Uncharacterized protein n=1 Tax=Mycobacterium ulcerans str. Harvey TaxID=1299332 RepID=A0ABN0QZU2_MYCUL|nr:hypothetical protein I551_3056 [Mycobacterium ulcerans str. Harvey]
MVATAPGAEHIQNYLFGVEGDDFIRDAVGARSVVVRPENPVQTIDRKSRDHDDGHRDNHHPPPSDEGFR